MIKIIDMFDKIKIYNYRGVRYATLDGLSQINVFFGKNNCGKSSILESIFLITGQSNPVLPITVNKTRGILDSTEENISLEFYKADPDNKIKIIAEGDAYRDMLIEMFKSTSHDVDLGGLETGKSDVAQSYFGLKFYYRLNGNDVLYHSDLTISADNIDSARIGRDKRYNETIFSQFIPSGYLHVELDDKLAKVIHNKQESEILDVLRIVEPNLKDIQLVGKKVMVDVGLQKRLPINVLGDGFRKILSLILSIYDCAGGILIIDEIDNGLHYSVMKKLWQSIVSAIKKNNVQIFVSTHNIDMLKSLVETISSEDSDMVSSYKLIRKDDDEVVALKYDVVNLSYSVLNDLEVR